MVRTQPSNGGAKIVMTLPGTRLATATMERLAARSKGLSPVLDEHVVFLMPVFRDAEVAHRSLSRLRRCYRHSRVVVISDGDPDFPGAAFIAAYGVEFIAGQNLYGVEHRGATVQRLLEAYLRAPAKVLVRMDTDARIDRRFRYLPRQEGVFGTIGARSGTVQGGCILISHGAAVALHTSGIFLSDRLLDPATSWGRFSTPENLERKTGQQRIAYDKVLHWGCLETGVPVGAFGEIFSVWKPHLAHATRLANADGRCAIVHPDKMESDGGGDAGRAR